MITSDFKDWRGYWLPWLARILVGAVWLVSKALLVRGFPHYAAGCSCAPFSDLPPRSDRSAKANRPMRRLLNQLAHAAVGKEDCQLQIVFRRLGLPPGVRKSGLGHPPPPWSANLESPSRWRDLSER